MSSACSLQMSSPASQTLTTAAAVSEWLQPCIGDTRAALYAIAPCMPSTVTPALNPKPFPRAPLPAQLFAQPHPQGLTSCPAVSRCVTCWPGWSAPPQLQAAAHCCSPPPPHCHPQALQPQQRLHQQQQRQRQAPLRPALHPPLQRRLKVSSVSCVVYAPQRQVPPPPEPPPLPLQPLGQGRVQVSALPCAAL